MRSNGICAIIEKIEVEQLATPETTYNFEVEDFHTYYVSESNVLVHNTCLKEINDKILDDIMKNPEKIQSYSLDEFKEIANNSSWETGTLTRSSQGAVGFKVFRLYDGQMISWHPAGSRWHFSGNAYWKISSGTIGRAYGGPLRFIYLGG